MLWGLERLSGVLTSLLLSLESPFTVLVAVLIVREHLVRLELAGVLVITLRESRRKNPVPPPVVVEKPLE